MVAVRLVSRNLVHEHFKRWLAAIVGIGLHAQPGCVATAGFHNKVSKVPKNPWPQLYVEQKFEIQIQGATVEDSYGQSHYVQRKDGKRDSDLLDSRIE